MHYCLRFASAISTFLNVQESKRKGKITQKKTKAINYTKVFNKYIFVINIYSINIVINSYKCILKSLRNEKSSDIGILAINGRITIRPFLTSMAIGINRALLNDYSVSL